MAIRMAGNDLEKPQVSVQEAPPLGMMLPLSRGSIWVLDAAVELEPRHNSQTKVSGYVV